MDFPKTSELSKGFWQPVYFRANLDTPERLVAGIIANIAGHRHLARASALDRLKCLYGREAGLAIEAVAIGLDYLENALRENGDIENISDVVSGLSLGHPVSAYDRDAPALADRWLHLTSSLHDQHSYRQSKSSEMMINSPADPVERDISRDRLAVLVMSLMAERSPQTRTMFNSHVLRLESDQKARLITHKAYVAFSGRHVAANFATLKPGRQKMAVDISKRLMWDLEQHREKEKNLLPSQTHEMILYHPSENDPTITTKQFDNVMDVVMSLKDEGNIRDIKVVPFESVPSIAEHILYVEEVY